MIIQSFPTGKGAEYFFESFEENEMATMLLIVWIALAVIIVVVIKVINRVDEKLQTPLFIWNDVGDTFAVCARSDFEDAKEYGDAIGGKIRVQDTLVFSNRESKYRSGYVKHGLSNAAQQEKNCELFVPFTSEGLMSFTEQEEFFTKPRDPKEFAEEKLLEALSEDWRLRFAFWWKKRHLGGLLTLAAILFVIVGFAFLFAALNERDESERSEEIAIYTTHEGGAHGIKTTRGEANRLLMYTDEYEGSRLIHGKISKIQPISAGLAQACFLQSNRMECGLTTVTSKIGDEMFVRFGNVTFWSSVDGKIGYHGGFRWLITKAEADALVATGKFKIID